MRGLREPLKQVADLLDRPCYLQNYRSGVTPNIHIRQEMKINVHLKIYWITVKSLRLVS